MDKEGMRNLLTAVLLKAIRDVYEHDVLKKRSHSDSSELHYGTACTYLLNGKADSDLAFLGIDISGKELYEKARTGQITVSTDCWGL